MPQRTVPPVRQIFALQQVAVRQQHGSDGLVGDDLGLEHRQIVGPVQEIGDLAEAFRLALRDETAA